MRLRWLWAMMALVCLSLSACQISSEVENQAYVLVLGIDRGEDGMLLLTARVPKIGKTKEPDPGEVAAKDSPYLTFTVAARSWPLALEALQQATPRRMNLSHIALLIFSERLAGETDFPELMGQIARTPHLYTTASLVICRGSAREFVEAGETIIGERMSAEIRAMLKHYADQGYIPEACFADVDYAACSFYSDPVAIWGELDSGANDAPGLQVLETPMKQRFCGTALMRQGLFVRAMSLRETQLLCLIRNQSNSISIEWEGRDYHYTTVGAPRRAVNWNGHRPTISLRLKLSPDAVMLQTQSVQLAQALKAEIEALIQECQREHCDPFGFADLAAGHFLTVQDWLEQDWRSLYANADLDIDVSISGGISTE